MSGITCLKDVEEFEKVPLKERDLPPNTYEAIRRTAEAHPDKLALRYLFQGTDYRRSTDYTYRQLMEELHRTANMFTELGVGPTDVVSMILPNLPQSFFTIFGAEAVGIVNPINPLLEPEVMADIMRAAETKVLVTIGPFVKTDIWQKVAAIADSIPTLKTIVTLKLGSFLPFPTKLLAPLLSRGGGKVKVKVVDFHKTQAAQPGDRLKAERTIKPDEIASFFHTGGTTGVPKLAQHTHFNEVFDAWAGSQFAELKGKILFCGLPLFHVNGVILTGLAPWCTGGTTVLGSPAGYRGDGILGNFWKIVEFYRVQFFSGVPTVYSALLNRPLNGADVSSLEACICGAAPMPVEVFKKFEERTQLKILEGYGLTEGTCASSANPPGGEKRIGSVGIRFPYQQMKTVRLDDDGSYERDCEVDEIGTVVIQGPNVFPGYKDDFHNQGIWVEAGGEGPWLNTGDLGRQDADGYTWLTGRKKELIIRGGHNIDPKLVEEPLVTHPKVALVAAVGRPDAHAGEVPVAYVQLEPGQQLEEEELLAFAKEHIGERAAVPKAVIVLDEIPLTPVGKIFKPALVRREIKTAAETALKELSGVGVEVATHPHHGNIARVRVAESDRAKAEEALGVFTFRYEFV